MLALEHVVEARALYARGWKISVIARHLGLNRRTVRRYVTGQGEPGARRQGREDPFEVFVEYARLRLVDDPHLWASALYDELVDLGYAGAYSSLTRALRTRGLRPHCEPCQATRGRDRSIIEHPAGEETQWDWVELPDPPEAWGWGKTAYLLVGSLAHSSRWRGVLAASTGQSHLIEAIDGVARRLDGVTLYWRFDRASTVCHPGSGRLLESFAPVLSHYGAGFRVCPARRGNRKGVVEKANHSAAQRWWRTLPDDVSPGQAQASLDRFCVRVGDQRKRRTPEGERTTVAGLAAGEGLAPVPTAPFPAELQVMRTVTPQALVGFRGNWYSIGPGRAGETVTVSHRLGTAMLEIRTAGGATLARHRGEPDSAGKTARAAEHVTALEHAVLAEFTDRAPCRRKERKPPSAAARAEATRLSGATPTAAPGEHQVMAAGGQVVDFSRYVAAAAERTRATAAAPSAGEQDGGAS
jgi:transposase